MRKKPDMLHENKRTFKVFAIAGVTALSLMVSYPIEAAPVGGGGGIATEVFFALDTGIVPPIRVNPKPKPQPEPPSFPTCRVGSSSEVAEACDSGNCAYVTYPICTPNGCFFTGMSVCLQYWLTTKNVNANPSGGDSIASELPGAMPGLETDDLIPQ